MEDHLGLDLLDELHERRGFADVDPLELSAGLQRRLKVALVPAGKVVDDGHAVAAGDQRVNEVRADEAGPAGHEGPHATAESRRLEGWKAGRLEGRLPGTLEVRPSFTRRK